MYPTESSSCLLQVTYVLLAPASVTLFVQPPSRDWPLMAPFP